MKILVTGSNGLVGNALRKVESEHEMVFASRQDADLMKAEQVSALLQHHKPDVVIHTAAKVGGIGGHILTPAEYFYNNIIINSHVIHYAKEAGVKKLLMFSSVCVFPDGIPVLKEELMDAGEPFALNYGYAYAKRMIDVQIRVYKAQFGLTNYCSIIPTNIFGENDMYNLDHGHVIPCLIHKLFLAKVNNTPFSVWGDGSAYREFIFADDLATMLMKIVELNNIPERIIISNSQQYRIREIVEKLVKAAAFNGQVVWQTDKSNGQHSRPTDISVLKSLLGDVQHTDLDIALGKSYQWFERHYPIIRL